MRLSIQGATHPQNVLAGHVGVNHGGLQIDVAEQVLNGADVVAVFKQMGSEAMAQTVDRGPLLQVKLAHRRTKVSLQGVVEQVMPPDPVTPRINGDRSGGKDPLPHPFPRCVGILLLQGGWQINPVMTGGAILLEQGTHMG